MAAAAVLGSMLRTWKVWPALALVVVALGVAAALAMRADGGDTAVSSPGGDGGPVSAGQSPLQAARLDLAARLGAAPLDIQLVSVRPAGFDGCLGVYRRDAACTEQFVAGAIALFEAGGSQYRYHFGGDRFVAASFVRGARIEDGSPLPAELPLDLAALFAGYAREDLALRLARPLSAVAVTAIVPVTFPDGCLALAAPGEACDAVSTPGAVILLAAAEREYRYHAGGSEDTWRLRSGQGTSGPQIPAEAVRRQLAVRQDLAARLNLPLAEVSVLSYRTVTWPDGCLGVYDPGSVCAQALVEGWLAKVVAGGREYRYHGGSGERFLAADFRPGAEVREP